MRKDSLRTDIDKCRQEVHLAKMAVDAAELLALGYSGHGYYNYLWQKSMLIPHLENALRIAQRISGPDQEQPS